MNNIAREYGYFVIVILFYFLMTVLRNSVWKNEVTLWSSVVQSSYFKARPHNNLGEAYKQERLPLLAIAEYEVAIHLNPNYAEAHFGRGVILSVMGKHQESLEEFMTSLSIKNDYAEPYNGIGLTYLKMNKVEESIEAFKTAIKLKPHFAEAHSNLGVAYSKIDLFDDAIKEYQKAIEYKPDYYKFYYYLGKAYLSLYQFNNAIRAFKAALKLKRNYEDALIGLEHAYGGKNTITQQRLTK